MIKIAVVDNFNDSSLSVKWNSLLGQTLNPLPFQRYEWAKNYWKYFSKTNEYLCIILAYDGTDLIAVLPLIRTKGKLFAFDDFSFLGSSVYDYFDFIIKEGKEGEVVEAILGYLGENHPGFRFYCKNIIANSNTRRYLSRIISERAVDGRIYSEDAVPVMWISGLRQVSDLKIKKSLSYDISRNIRRLRSLGELSLQRPDDINSAMRLLETFFQQHKERWESAGGYSAYVFKARQQFTRDLISDFFAEKIANIYTLLLDSRPIATCLTLTYRGRFLYLSPAFDSRYASYSPGKVLLYKLVNHCIAQQYAIFDFGIGREPYKLQWPCEIIDLYSFFVYSNGGGLFNFWIKMRTGLRMYYSLKLHPFLRKFKTAVYIWRFFRRAQGSLSQGRRS